MTRTALPNVFVLTLDALRRDSVSVYEPSLGTTPFLAEFAQECVVFDDAISSSCWTLPSHSSLFTGLYPSFHGATKRFWYLAEATPTMAQLLKTAGYRTAAFTGGPYLHWAFGLDRGFDHYLNCFERRPSSFGARLRSLRRRFRRTRTPIQVELLQRATVKVTARDLNKEFAEWLDSGYGDGRPLFAFINYFDPHGPWLRRNNEFTPPFREEYENYGSRLIQVLRQEIPLDSEVQDHLIRLYRNEVFHLDSQLSEVMSLLKHRGLYRNSVIIILSDHGEMLGEHGLWDHIMLYEPVIRIPLLMKLPNSELGGKRISHLVQNIDLLPTIFSLIGLPLGHELQGTDLMGLVEDDSPLQRGFAVSEFYPDAKTAETYGSRFRGEFIAYIEGAWKYIYNSSAPDELYNRDKDPFEENNLIDSALVPSSVRDGLLARLRGNVNWELAARDVEIDQEVLNRLEGLGYV